MKHLTLLLSFFLTFTFSNKAFTPEKNKLTYFYIEDLSVNSYGKWLNTMDKSSQEEITYACIPAKIIGIKKEYAKKLEIRLKSSYKTIKRIELTPEEAEKKCANQRDSSLK